VRVIVAGGLMLAFGTALTTVVDTQGGLLLTLGVLSAAGAGAGGISILLGVIARLLPPERRSFAAGVINAGGSFGQFMFAPLLQAIIGAAGWVAAMLTMSAVALLTIPLAWPLRERSTALAGAAQGASQPVSPAPGGLGRQIRVALRDPSYLCLLAGFFTCGFHIAFLVTHLPGEVALCGLPADVSAMALALIGLFNIAGSLSAGMLASRVRMKYMLVGIYAARAAIIALYLVAPKTASTFYWFAASLGFTWLATLPPTAGLVGKLFGTRYLGTLIGFTMLSHQAGAFFGAWLGGLALERFGNFTWMWYADIMLALAAVAANLPIREARVVLRPATAGAA
jgi:predicted MFS family arabinose efflux permease